MEKTQRYCPLCHKTLKHKDGFYSCKTKNCLFDAEKNPVFGHWGDVFTNPGDTEADMIDSAGQCLRFRVGPVFGKEILKLPGIWISYQERYLKTKLFGDFLMSAETWEAIKTQIDKRIKTFNAKAYSFKAKKK